MRTESDETQAKQKLGDYVLLIVGFAGRAPKVSR
jgi:hypothetical protein